MNNIIRGTVRQVKDGIEVFLTSENCPRWVKIRNNTLEDIKRNIMPLKKDDIPEKPGIYLLTCLIGEQKSYSGKGNNLVARIKDHANSKSISKYLKQRNKIPQAITMAIDKYGWNNFEIRLLEVFETGEKTNNELLDIEEAYIAHLKLLTTQEGYNILPRGSDTTGFKHSEETKKMMSKNKIGKNSGKNHYLFGKKMNNESKIKMSIAGKGKKLSIEHKMKLAKLRTGRKNTEETKLKMSLSANKIPVNQIDLKTGTVIKTWISATDAGKDLLGNKKRAANIISVCKNKLKSAYGFKWEYANIIKFSNII